MEEMKTPDLVLLDENSSFPFTSQKSAVLIAVPLSQLGVGSRSSILTSQKWIALLIVLIASLITAMVQLVRFQNIFKGQQSIFEGFALSNASLSHLPSPPYSFLTNQDWRGFVSSSGHHFFLVDESANGCYGLHLSAFS